MTVTAAEKRETRKILQRLGKAYPDAHCALRFETPLQLLIATILSAQCTDERVNLVTRELFKKYRTARDFAQARLTSLEKAIRSTGFFRNKAKNIKACCAELVEKYDGKIPTDLDVLVQLPGVGRKTANVVLGTAFGLATGVVVDTHVARISQRLGLTAHQDAVRIERDLIRRLPRKEWIDYSHRLIWHGRRVCQARRPLCDECPLQDVCPRHGVV